MLLGLGVGVATQVRDGHPRRPVLLGRKPRKIGVFSSKMPRSVLRDFRAKLTVAFSKKTLQFYDVFGPGNMREQNGPSRVWLAT